MNDASQDTRANVGGNRLVFIDAEGEREWVESIRYAWQKSIEGTIETGQLLVAAKADLPYGEFHTMIGRSLPFGPRTAQRLMALADHPIISDATMWSHLPPSWRALSELSRISEQDWQDAAPEISPEMTVQKARTLADRYVLRTMDAPIDTSITKEANSTESAPHTHTLAETKQRITALRKTARKARMTAIARKMSIALKEIDQELGVIRDSLPPCRCAKKSARLELVPQPEEAIR